MPKKCKGWIKIPLANWWCHNQPCSHRDQDCTQHYSAPVVQVPDASLVVNVCNDVLHPKKSKAYIEALETEQTRMREQHEAQGERPLLKLDEARSKGLSFDWEKQEISEPLADNLGTHHLTPNLEEVLEFFDWSPFFWAWELKGTYPQIFDKKNTVKKHGNYMTMPRNYWRISSGIKDLPARQWWEYGLLIH